ncbi:DNA cytosine methyltransferase [Cylindrospermum sp. FACHB-282]|uniref:DNA cytosine methyltransferase n=1 Tax=Cylindrospermum sp. FACHB-282 TaxID=2692794 RepID=UPI001682DD36|nr:DNA cytosine methyltransferase [Cylindrospermum sp. FACHB-282]MBD2386026.1 DNA cytosine methyltransferase [Cylindrospermum sp. FACHB-282]
MQPLSCIDFFAGIGAWELAIAIINEMSGFQIFSTFGFIEINPAAQLALRLHHPLIPIHADIKTYTPLQNINVYFISFPCTGTSNAGHRTGLSHAESGLWFEALRCICIGRPRFIVIEQPEGFIHRGLRAVIAGLRMAGYSTEVEIISAAEFGAPHRRNRVFVVAHANYLSLQQRQGWKCWDEQIGMDIEKIRAFGERSQAFSRSISVDDGVPPWILGVSYLGWWKTNKPPLDCGVPRKTAGRREAINLVSRSIVPCQAAIALMRVKFLADLI